MSATTAPWKAVGTTVRLPNVAGGFDLRGCPDPEALARRIVACVNACAGSALEQDAAPGLLERLQADNEAADILANAIEKTNDSLREQLSAAESKVDALTKRLEFHRSGCACDIDEDGETILKWCLPHSEWKKRVDALMRIVGPPEGKIDMVGLVAGIASPELLRNALLKVREQRDALMREKEELRAALQEISLGAGEFSIDPLEHAENCIESMKDIAIRALVREQQNKMEDLSVASSTNHPSATGG